MSATSFLTFLSISFVAMPALPLIYYLVGDLLRHSTTLFGNTHVLITHTRNALLRSTSEMHFSRMCLSFRYQTHWSDWDGNSSLLTKDQTLRGRPAELHPPGYTDLRKFYQNSCQIEAFIDNNDITMKLKRK